MATDIINLTESSRPRTVDVPDDDQIILSHVIALISL